MFSLHFLNAYWGTIVHSDRFAAEDESGAIRLAEERRTLAPMELWVDGRCIKRWDAFPSTDRD